MISNDTYCIPKREKNHKIDFRDLWIIKFFKFSFSFLCFISNLHILDFKAFAGIKQLFQKVVLKSMESKLICTETDAHYFCY